MHKRLILLLLLFVCCGASFSQSNTGTSCGQKEIMKEFYTKFPQYKKINDQVEKLLSERNKKDPAAQLLQQKVNGVVILPVVVHIIHNNGTENISNAQVLQGIQHLNEAFANTGYYDPADGVNTQIQFCLAQRDPLNNLTNGITRDVSSYTVMGSATYYSDDQNVKNINRWDPLCYINIWLVKSIPTSVVGYAYLPSAHGTVFDGIVEEAAYFGSSASNDVVAIHEMGHYLGLYHTFEGACTNNDCTTDGDKVCDTPPDQSTAGVSCTSTVNSCTTDALSGFTTDQPDLTQDYLDYGNFNCMKVFTQGQANRMNWFIQNVRKSLLSCKSCMLPCPSPVTANFISSAPPFIAGNSYLFTNTSVNAAGYEWYVNGVLQSTAANFNYLLPAVATYSIKLIAKSANALCDDAVKTITVNSVCGVAAGFTKSAAIVPAGTNINFTNTSTGSTNYEWYVNGALQSTAANYSYTSTTAGKYIVRLVANNNITNCRQEFADTVEYTCPVSANFTPLSNTAIINTALTFNSTGSGATTYQWFVNGAAAGTGTTLTYTFTAIGLYTVQLIAGNGICSATKHGTVYITDNCNNPQYLFQKNYTVDGSSTIYDIRSTADGGSVMAGQINKTSGVSLATVLKVDAAGNTEWMNTYANSYQGSWFNKIKQTSDGGYIAIGLTTGTGMNNIKILIVKTLSNGTKVWSREYNPGDEATLIPTDIIQLTDGTYCFTASVSYSGGLFGTTDAVVGKLDLTGNIIWMKNYDGRFGEGAQGIAEDNSQLIVCGFSSTINNNSNGFLLKLNKSDGSIVWTKTYQPATTRDLFNSVTVVSGGYYIDELSGSATQSHVYLKTDFTGQIVYSKYSQPFGNVQSLINTSYVKPDGNIISLELPFYASPTKDFYIQEINPFTGILWTKKYNLTNTGMKSITPSADNGILAVGYKLNGSAGQVNLSTYLMKLDSAGNAGDCPSENVNVQLLPFQINSVVADYTAKDFQPQIITNHTFSAIDVVTETICQRFIKCDSVPPPPDTCLLCNTIKITGQDTICSLQNSFSFKATKNILCPLPAQWKIDTSFAQVISFTDTAIQIKFKKTGTVKLYTQITTACDTLRDSLLINIITSPGSVNLGPDIKLCKFSTLKLNAGSGYKTYVWNDGSVDSVLTAYNTGQYFVMAEDYCGNIYTDTITITQAPDVPFDLGPDLKMCKNDTLTITAPGSFSKYTWSGTYNINSSNGKTVKIWPAADTSYTVIAEVAKGCTVVDTIRIKVNKPIPISIGRDTSFCVGGNAVFTAPAGFVNYVWQDASAGQTFTTTQKGLYWVRATDANGCVSADTAEVKQLYAQPLISLGNDIEICPGEIHIFNAGNSFATYLWQDNSANSAYSTNQAGAYWVQVSSNEGCTARDTVYRTDKECIKGIFFPNAFTPNNDGINDIFKPIINIAALEKITFSIYNRYGEKLFETTDPLKGWNGTYRGKPQNPDTFVWYCTYRLTGAVDKMEKGIVILIR